MRTDLTTDLDGALAGRNAGSKGFWECARSGNGNMMTDLLDEDGKDYEELEGLGEAVEEMTPAESAAADRGDRTAFRPYRDVRPGEQPPYAPQSGRAWMRRRIPTNNRRPGGYRQVRVRWVQVSPRKYGELVRAGAILEQNGRAVLQGMGFLPAGLGIPAALAGGLIGGVLLCKVLKRR